MLDLFGAGLISCIPASPHILVCFVLISCQKDTPLALRRFVSFFFFFFFFFFFATKSCSYIHTRDVHYPCNFSVFVIPIRPGNTYTLSTCLSAPHVFLLSLPHRISQCYEVAGFTHTRPHTHTHTHVYHGYTSLHSRLRYYTHPLLSQRKSCI
ncbi:hypothetical protein B0T13DRAFT_86455 [Neurospora crassa]|nr:hypothetical protein B0T13DRAFT_86455 [Neurospora crassa]